MTIALVSCRELSEPDFDAPPLARALAGAEIPAEVVAWDDATVDWPTFELAVLRSCWNYPVRCEAFRSWLRATSVHLPLFNPVDVVEWNLHKGYLLDLERRGISVTPTTLVRSGHPVDIVRLCADRGWTDIVVKPAVSGGSYRTQRTSSDRPEEAQAHLDLLTADGDALVQPYLPSVEGYGERSIVVVEDQVTHAVRKSPRFSGDRESVSAQPMPISPAEASFAQRVVEAIGQPLLYARVDIAPGADGQPLLMELELIEPSLFFAQGPEALERFVAGIARRRPPPQ